MKESHITRQELLRLLVPAFVGAVVYVGANRLVNPPPQKKELKLEYTIAEAKPFGGEDYNFAVYNLIVRNTGGEYVSGVKSTIQVPLAEFKEAVVTGDPNLEYSDTTMGDKYTLNVSSLNPAETVAVSMWTISKDSLPSIPIVSVRAEGVTGTRRTLTEEKQPNNLLTVIVVLVAVWVAVFVETIMRKYIF